MHSKKVILVTGASAGMGKDAAIKMVAQGHEVYGAARRVDKMDDLVKAGGHAVKMDITSESDVDAAVAKIIAEQGRIDVLVNNAGFGLYGAVEDVSIEDAKYQFDVNLFGLAYITQKVLPHMRKQNSGRIVNISSMGGKLYTPLGAWYHATKHALEGWSDCLRIETKQFGIEVVIVEPGGIETEWSGIMAENLAKQSGAGPYRNMVESLGKASGTIKASPVGVIGDVIAKASLTRKPRTRYVKGAMAKPMMFIRTRLGDRIFDNLLHSMMR
jgi:NAD(P)-dependent dehydrogenase (short-subunit alcohol dehydrogenase family)